MILTAEEVAEIAARAEKATPGPWSPYEIMIEGGDGRAVAWGTRTFEDQSFVAAARTDVPALCATVEALRAERDALVAMVGESTRRVLREGFLTARIANLEAALRNILSWHEIEPHDGWCVLLMGDEQGARLYCNCHGKGPRK